MLPGIQDRGAKVGVTSAGEKGVLEECRSEQGPAGKWLTRHGGQPICCVLMCGKGGGKGSTGFWNEEAGVG